MKNKIEFIWCSLCQGMTILCPRCGNNSCNGAYGRIDKDTGEVLDQFKDPEHYENGIPCPACKELDNLEKKMQESGIMKMIEDLIPEKKTCTSRISQEWLNDACVDYGGEEQ